MAAVALAAPKSRKPDLVTQRVVGLSAGTSAGSTLALTAKVVNRGTGKAKRSHLTAALSVDRKSGDDARLGTGAKVQELKPGRKARVGLRLALPAEVSPGSYYVLVCADARRVVRERNERNNCRAAPTTVGAGGALPGPPTTPAPPTAADPGGGPRRHHPSCRHADGQPDDADRQPRRHRAARHAHRVRATVPDQRLRRDADARHRAGCNVRMPTR